MGLKRETGSGQFELALGAQYVEALREHPADEVRALAETKRAKEIFDAVNYVMDEASLPSFLHSAMCAMSLPVRNPKDEKAPIIRQDGNYTLIIQPRSRMEPVGPGGEFVEVVKGVPWGKHARLVLLFIMTEAVTKRTREVYLGETFSAWLRRMGITNTRSGGPRGTRALVQEQVDRLMNCEWSMRWDEKIPGSSAKEKGKRKGSDSLSTVSNEISAFAVNDMKLVNQYAGMKSKEGTFVSHFVLSEAFFDNLLKHSVPFNDRAVVVLHDSCTQMDLYTWLAYRLPRIKPGTEVRISWTDLAKHLGNENGTMTRFRQTVRNAWEVVSGVYQQARNSVDVSGLVIRLRYAEPPTKGHLTRTHLPNLREEPSRSQGRKVIQGDLLESIDVLPSLGLPRVKQVTDSKAENDLLFPPSGALDFASRELYLIGRDHGSGNDVTKMADAFRKVLGAELTTLAGDKLKDRWMKYCQKWPKPA